MPRTKKMGRAANGAGSIRKKTIKQKGKEYTYWEGRVTIGSDPITGKIIQKSISGKTQKEVAQKVREMTTQVDKGEYLAPCKLTVTEWLDIWQRDYLVNVKPSTKLLYQRRIKDNIVPKLGSITLDKLDARIIQAFYTSLLNPTGEGQKGLSPQTIRAIHNILHTSLDQAARNDLIRKNPTDGCKLPRVEKPDIRPMSEEQVKVFLAHIDGSRYEYAYKVALFTGIRRGELLGLQWDCVDLEHRTIVIKQQLCREDKRDGEYYISTPKNGKTRVLSIPQYLVDVFHNQMIKQDNMRKVAGDKWIEHGLVFTNRNGGYLSARTIYDSFKRIANAIGLPSMRFHDLRHTYAVMAIRNGDDIKTISANLGHASAAFTLDVYMHVLDEMKVSSSDRMDAAIMKLIT